MLSFVLDVGKNLNCFQDFIVEHSGPNKKEYKIGAFTTAHLHLAVFHEVFSQLYESS